ncbi:T9SS type A sorting domain-containing protein [Chryseobacterium sp. 2TAF14]|uniref:T9SS type A sorting domain-containing protein n=1 Tax=Chryseobacterium sp. 2TAF14 TaxID=3233007 RepID=UPI003F90626B
MNKTLLFLSVFFAGHFFAQFSVDNIIEVPFHKNLANDKPAEMIAADFNNDGNMDVVVDGDLPLNQSGFIQFNSKPIFFSGNGSSNLIPLTTAFAHPGNSSFICDAADYNKDGFADILVADFWANGMRLYNGNGDFTFTLAHTLPTGVHGAKGKFNDIDQDGDLDIVNISSGSAAVVTLHVFENLGNTFNKSSSATITGTDFHQPDHGYNIVFFILDLNRDNRHDVISFSTDGAANNKERMNSWIQNVDKTFTAEVQIISSDMQNTVNERFTYWIKDVNGDHHKDLLFIDDIHSKSVKVAYSEPQTPHFGTSADFQGPSFGGGGGFLGYFLQKAVWGDVDNDGEEDFVTHNRFYAPNQNSFEVIKDPLNINGNFSRLTLDMENTEVEKHGHGLLLADLDNDNDLELVSLGNDDILRIFNNKTLLAEAIEEGCSEKDIKIYPSPAKEYIHIDMCESQSADILSVQIYGMNGDLIATVPQEEWKNPISTSGLIAGAYVIRIEMSNKKIFSKKFLKE